MSSKDVRWHRQKCVMNRRKIEDNSLLVDRALKDRARFGVQRGAALGEMVTRYSMMEVLK